MGRTPSASQADGWPQSELAKSAFVGFDDILRLSRLSPSQRAVVALRVSRPEAMCQVAGIVLSIHEDPDRDDSRCISHTPIGGTASAREGTRMPRWTNVIAALHPLPPPPSAQSPMAAAAIDQGGRQRPSS